MYRSKVGIHVHCTHCTAAASLRPYNNILFAGGPIRRIHRGYSM